MPTVGVCNQEELVQYRSSWFSDGRSERLVCQGRSSFIGQFFNKDELMALFGGFCLSEDAAGEEYLGVWGRRRCSHFRRLLRERGADFVLVPREPELRLRVMAAL